MYMKTEKEQIYDALVFGIRSFFEEIKFKKAILGLSGGIDSAVVAALTCEALGSENVWGILMPSRFSSEHSIKDAEALAKNLRCRHDTIPIESTFSTFLKTLEPLFADQPFDVTEENMQARIRAVILMALSNKFGHILLNASNKSELSVGYTTLYGDSCGALAVIGDLYKTQVIDLAHYINRNGEIIPQNTILKPPSAELRLNQKDSDSLPEYEVLDAILRLHLENGYGAPKIVEMGYDKDVIINILKMVSNSEYKRRQMPPVLRVTENNSKFVKMYKLPLLTVLFFFLFLPFLLAQNGSGRSVSIDSTSVYVFRNTIDSTDFPVFVRYDSTLTGIEKRANPSWNNVAFADLGNIGQAQKNMLFGYQQSSGFHFKTIPYNSYNRNSVNPIYFRSLLPYSEVYYLLGAKKEQDVGFYFSSNLYRGLTLGLLFDLTFCPGFFPHQRAATNDLSVSLRYFSPNYRYGVISAFSHYKIQANENGGIESDSLFESSQLRPEAIPVNLTTGSNTIRNYGVEVTQYFHLSRPLSPQKTKNSADKRPDSSLYDSLTLMSDSLSNAIDSLANGNEIVLKNNVIDSLQNPDSHSFDHERRRFNWGRLALRTKMSDLSWLYSNDNLSRDFFPNYYNDSTRTHDSTRYFIFENTFSYSNANINSLQKDYQFRYYLSFTHQYIQIQSLPQNDAYDSMALPNAVSFYCNQLIPKVRILTRLFRTFELRASGDYVLNGYNKEDFSLSGTMGNTFGRGKNQTDLRFGVTTASQMPEWFYGYYSGNHYRWENRCDKVNYLIFSGELENRLFHLKGDYFLLSNYIYLNHEALPETAEDIQNVLKISLRSKVKAGKYWIFNNFLAYQNAFNSAVIQLPDFLYNGTVYFQMSLAKNALILAPGISLFYNTSYFADAYTPALNSFYLQEKKKTGNYLYADLFVDINIKHARIFVKYRHFTNPLLQNTEMANKYYMIPHYPQVGGGIYAGVSWRFIN